MPEGFFYYFLFFLFFYYFFFPGKGKLARVGYGRLKGYVQSMIDISRWGKREDGAVSVF
jgi:hypothetical protein